MSTDPTSTKASPTGAKSPTSAKSANAARNSAAAVPTPDPSPGTAQSSPGPAAQPSPGPAAHGRRFKHRELDLADGGKLVLEADGSISQVDPAGTSKQTWEPADPDWASHAIRFGLFPQDATVAPSGRFIEGMRPPRR